MKYFIFIVLSMIGCSRSPNENLRENSQKEANRFTVELFGSRIDSNITVYTDTQTGQQYITKSYTSSCPLAPIPKQ